MNNSNALVWLAFTKLKGQMRNIARKPFSLIITLALSGLTLFLMIQSFSNPVTQTVQLSLSLLNIISGGIVFLFLLVYVFNKNSALVYENDANYIFVGPFSDKQTRTYIIITNFFQTILTALMLVAYILVFFNTQIMGLSHIIGIFLSVMLHFLVVLFYFVYGYIKEATQDEPKHINRIPVFIISLMIIVMLLVVIYPDFSLQGLEHSLNKPLFKMIPFIGSFGWIGNAFVYGDTSVYFIITFLLALIFMLMHFIYTFKGNFIEKAITDAQFVSSMMKRVKEGDGNALEASVNLDHIKKRSVKANFLNGSMAIFSKQLLVLKKTRKILPIGLLIFSIIYGFVGLFVNDILTFKLLMIFCLMIGNDNDFLRDELTKPYIYLIPENELKKLLSTLIVPFTRVLLTQVINFIFLTIMGNPVLDSLLYIKFVMSCYLIILMVDALLIKLLKGSKNQVIKMYLNMFFYLIALVPSGLLLFALMNMVPQFSFEYLIVVPTLINVALSFVGFVFAQSILRGNNLNN